MPEMLVSVYSYLHVLCNGEKCVCLAVVCMKDRFSQIQSHKFDDHSTDGVVVITF